MKIQKKSLPYRLLISSLISSCFAIVGCNSDHNSAELARSVELEKLRADGTIIEKVTIINDHIRLSKDDKHQLKVMGLDSNGKLRDVTNEIKSWTSSDPSIATVDSKGLVTAVANSTVNQGIVTITATTILEDIYGEGEISVSDVGVTNIALKTISPITDEVYDGNIYTCIGTPIRGDVTYNDGYVSENTVKNMEFSLNKNTSATITTDGTLYTSSATIEDIIITAKIGNVSKLLAVTADPQFLDNIDVLRNDEITSLITLNVGERMQISSQATLESKASKQDFVIDNAISWSQVGQNVSGITTEGDNKGTILALKPGVTRLTGTCGGKEAIATLQVTGEADIDSMQINDGTDITLEPSDSIELTLTANYKGTPASLNVSEFAQWSTNGGSKLVEAKPVELGTNKASYKLTSTGNAKGVVIVSAIYDGVASTIRVNIE
ncbi:Ig-like domain-containing protein [Pseudocolwellia agarivorans]|uniref:Ig-like domain-containing protein n=1 Tax=Pseudocolwellia agarivorans TaxID=1911682 RepID=UPI0009875AA2|nr:Ig-like domain-containing protein [Pseudocolwellia agarivorans]